MLGEEIKEEDENEELGYYKDEDREKNFMNNN